MGNILRKDISDEEIERRVKEFLEKNKAHYSQEHLIFLLDNALWGRRSGDIDSDLRQIYAHLDLLEEENIYKEFMRMIERNFPKAKKIVEVGCGRVPALSSKLAEKYHITVYDPRVIEGLYDGKNFIIKKEKFTNDTDIGDANLIIGFMPQGAHQTIAANAVKNNRDFMMAMSDKGDAEEEKAIFLDREEIEGNTRWSIRKELEKSPDVELKVEELQGNPVFSSKRVK